MLTHPTIDQMHQLGLAGMARAFAELEANPQSADLSHAEWLALLLDREATDRYERRLRARLRYARLRHQAAVEDVDYRTARGLDRALFQTMIAGRWIEEAQNLIIEGPAGVGKSWLACALGHKACRDNRSVLYQRVPRMFSDLALARGDGRYPRLMRALGGVKLLILDDWGLEPLGPEQRHDMLEIVEDRYGRGATLITSQIPVDRWHDLIGEPTLADAILVTAPATITLPDPSNIAPSISRAASRPPALNPSKTHRSSAPKTPDISSVTDTPKASTLDQGGHVLGSAGRTHEGDGDGQNPRDRIIDGMDRYRRRVRTRVQPLVR